MTMLPLKQTSNDGAPDRFEPAARAPRSPGQGTFTADAFGCVLAVCSALTAEFLAGCAAYAHAMYPHPIVGEQSDAMTVAGSTGRRLMGANRNIRVVAYPAALRVEDPEAGPPSRPGPAALLRSDVASEPSIQFHPIRTWYTSISAMAVSLWEWDRKRRAMRRAMIELEGLDDRALRDIGLTRFDIGDAIRGDLDLR
ncbi:uncharacterized protein YjiS (DUF1127 family) [Bradyrhizobium japonicum]|uniref:DUF1127 domain-containing protein n=2 Tax=Nitrobacteraceae TaxID=41294 RepID=UPI000483D184|nr:DUF1127 domain-containing protein [Bradyrhizobium japonicum]WLB94339.1 DUF1127 domain-containing protein [Bradyrhizobium japonicum USDA 123]MCP1740170.1 uncharacterized protein YjiS (DUF1127 family) [Bradyrhizobium japonicum]MCP1778403.1 uncharacterized protein YjiS (DUF1127 family) [Bradyrhizobium japonicum]MCP1857846.1 uncharacterized protein YjiS (DUF1127 family) [Bradyrhizobium japonicum]MCP1888660.1 uncharacterized protein YjiS (DUF1127 family) [Bradyrhizobium japonicum]